MHDVRGNPTSTTSPVALEHAERALWRLISFFGDPQPDLDAAAASDPGWALPHIMKAGFWLTLTERRWQADAAAAIAAAEQRAGTAHERERLLLQGVQLGWRGDWEGACRCWDTVLRRWPCDGLALIWAHLFDFHRGDAYELRRRVARVLPQWSEDDPLYPYLLGMLAFGFEEDHLHREAEDHGRRALAHGVVVPWAVHAVAHVMEMQGRYDEGAAWLRQHQAAWSQGSGFAGHLWWHLGLFRLERLDTEGALRLYDEHLSGDAVQIALQRLDATALLWRLHLLGVDTGPRFTTLASGWDTAPEHSGWSPFNDLHVMLALLGADRVDQARAWLAQVERGTAEWQAAGLRERDEAAAVGLTLQRGLLQHAQGDDTQALETLLKARSQSQRIGGSHAQRDLIDQTLLAAAARGGHRGMGRALLGERHGARAVTPLAQHWAGRFAG
ncbi:tetratricopeptide repeat protein [Caldimonas brevitalea]|uniref:Tetratricopeptide repeat protein 38 n=1 Tax=Caldimonas brevitalea TaxID=413882 RepID=A0A0G3BVH3_9BURK|nr:tetratricopeptide repeat protein [Caldimonas brevitalea]AKJ32028.1 hypothetical protein AAW51_5337 [Caldimonas brevitalea]